MKPARWCTLIETRVRTLKQLRPASVHAGFVAANRRDLRALHAAYALPGRAPFFVDISGPELGMNLAAFTEYCTEDNAILRVLKVDGRISAFYLISDIQFGLELANLDLGFTGAYPLPETPAALALALDQAIRTDCLKANLSRLQIVAAGFETEKIALMKSIGFNEEGLLRQHFFYGGAMHDLLMLARCDSGRVNP